MQLVAVKSAPPPPAPRFSDAEVQAMQRAAIRLFDHWGVTDAQAAVLLGDIAVRTYQRWKQGEYGRWNVDLAARLSNLIGIHRSEEHTSELQSLMRISYAVFCLKTKQ